MHHTRAFTVALGHRFQVSSTKKEQLISIPMLRKSGERIWSAAASGIPRDAALARTGRKAVPRPAHSAALVTALQVASRTKQVRRRFRKEPMFTGLCQIHARLTAAYRFNRLKRITERFE
ncbi:MAG: hypothetical protein PHN85_05175 [Kiritimatiellae bacterium]|nr:hypothetical protein [Kiritimatiellia bacterium]